MARLGIMARSMRIPLRHNLTWAPERTTGYVTERHRWPWADVRYPPFGAVFCSVVSHMWWAEGCAGHPPYPMRAVAWGSPRAAGGTGGCIQACQRQPGHLGVRSAIHDGIKGPCAGDSLELVHSCGGEDEPGTGHEVFHGTGNQDLAGDRLSHHSRRDDHRNPGCLSVGGLTFPGVDPRANRESDC